MKRSTGEQSPTKTGDLGEISSNLGGMQDGNEGEIMIICTISNNKNTEAFQLHLDSEANSGRG